MAITQSGMYYITFRDVWQNDVAVDIMADTLKVALFTDTLAPNFSTDSVYSATGEASGTGYTSGGTALTSPAVSSVVGPPSYMQFAGANPSWASSSITAKGALLYDSTTGNRNIILVNFGSNYQTVSGTFTVQWDPNGIFRLQVA